MRFTRFPHTIEVSYTAQVKDGGGGFTEGATTVVYDGKADVQDGGIGSLGEVLKAIADAGFEGRGNAIVFLPGSVSISDKGIKEGHDFTWTDRSKTGKVTGINHMDNVLAVSFE